MSVKMRSYIFFSNFSVLNFLAIKFSRSAVLTVILSFALAIACSPDPIQTIDDPGQTTDNPGQSTDNPGGNTDDPGGNTDNPGGNTDDPGGNTEDPGGNTIDVQDVTISIESLEMGVGENQTLTATVLPEDATNRSVSWASDNEEIVTVSQEGVVTALSPGNANVTVTTTDQGKTATCAVVVWPAMTAVDLGLSVRWAECNLGATQKHEDGGLYQWAGTNDVSSTSINISWQNCPYHDGRYLSTKGWKKYNSKNTTGSTVDNKKVLEPKDDAASVILGRGWRIPTAEEWNEFMKNTTREWMEINGRQGYLFTSAVEGHKDKSIFLPASGQRYSNYPIYYINKTGDYWASTVNVNDPSQAGCFEIQDESDNVVSRDRYMGMSVRAVIE